MVFLYPFAGGRISGRQDVLKPDPRKEKQKRSRLGGFSLWFRGRPTTEDGVQELTEDSSRTVAIYLNGGIKVTAEAVWIEEVVWIGGEIRTAERRLTCNLVSVSQ